MFDLSVPQIIAIIVFAFFCEYVDSTLGMGYGTTLTPVLMIFGFKTLDIVRAVLLSELITGLLASFFHHREGNVDLKPKSADIFKISKMLSPLGYVETFKKNRAAPSEDCASFRCLQCPWDGRCCFCCDKYR